MLKIVVAMLSCSLLAGCATTEEPAWESTLEPKAPAPVVEVDPNRTVFAPNAHIEGFTLAHNLTDAGTPDGANYTTADAWHVAEYLSSGDVWVEDNTCFLGEGNSMTGIRWDGPLPSMNYEVTLDAKRVDGRDFFCGLTFRYGDDPCTLIVGGWGGGLVGISSLDGMDASENTTATWREFENERWYTIRLRVTPGTIQAWIDSDKVVEVTTTGRRIGIRFEVEPCRPLGIATWRTTGAIKNVRIRAFDEGRA